MRSVRALVSVGSIGAALAAGGCGARAVPSAPASAIAALPLVFELNQGQTNSEALFVARAGRCTAFLTPTEAVFAGGAAPLRMRPVGGDPSPRVEGVRELPGRVNWYVGNDSAKWRTGIRTFGAVAYRDVWPGVDLVFHGDRRELEYDFVVAPGADAGAIAMRFTGADGLAVDDAGDLVIALAGGEIRQRRPVVHEETADGARRDVAGRYVVRGADVVAFEVDGRDAANRLVIDPVLVYGTYIGGTGEADTMNPKAAVDSRGELVVTSLIESRDFPTVRAVQATDPAPNLSVALGVSKLNAAGTALVYSTYLSGTDGGTVASNVAVDGQRNAYIAGTSNSTNYPTTPGAFETSKLPDVATVVVTKLDPAGALAYSTYVNADQFGYATDIAVDAAGSAYITGTYSSGSGTSPFPATAGAFRTALSGVSDAFVIKLNPAGSGLVYATLLGGDSFEDGVAIAVDSSGSAYVAGATGSANFPTKNPAQAALAGTSDMFVAKLDPAGADIVYATYLGGVGSEADRPSDIAVDADGRAYVVGNGGPVTLSGVPPLVPSTPLHGILARLSPTGGFDYITGVLETDGAHGTLGTTKANAVGVDAARDVYVVGTAASTDMPQRCAVGAGFRGTVYDAFVVKLKGDGSAFVYSTYLGGGSFDWGTGLAVSPAGEAYVAVETRSSDVTPMRLPIQRVKPGSPAVATWFVAKLSAEDGSGPGACAPRLSPARVDSFLVPSSVKVSVNATDKTKSKVTVTGALDAGSANFDFSQPASIQTGDLRFAAPAPVHKGKTYTYKSAGMTAVVTPGAAGTSRAAFKLTFTGDLAGRVTPDGELRIQFSCGSADCVGFVDLAGGSFVLGRNRGALEEPNLAPKSVKASVLGAGKDAVTVVLSLATDGVTPPAPSDFTFGFEGHFSVTVPASNFTKVGDKMQTKAAFQGITKVVLDYAKETITVTAKGPDLSTFATGANPLTVNVAVGTETRAVSVIAVRKGKKLSY